MGIDFGDFFEFKDPFEKKALRLHLTQEWVTGPYSEKWLPVARGEWMPPSPVVFNAFRGCQVRDFLWSGAVVLFVVSSRVVDILLEHRLTGWATYPVEVRGWKGEIIPGYFGFAIKGLDIERDSSRSEGLIKCVPKGKPTQYYKGLYFDERQWDGNDFFLVKGRTVVNGRVVRALKNASVTNVAFTALPDVQIRGGVVCQESVRGKNETGT